MQLLVTVIVVVVVVVLISNSIKSKCRTRWNKFFRSVAAVGLMYSIGALSQVASSDKKRELRNKKCSKKQRHMHRGKSKPDSTAVPGTRYIYHAHL